MNGSANFSPFFHSYHFDIPKMVKKRSNKEEVKNLPNRKFRPINRLLSIPMNSRFFSKKTRRK